MQFEGGAEGFAGESKNTNYQGWNELWTFELGVENTISIGSGGSGSGAGRASFQPFTITKSINTASPKLFERLATGQQISSARLLAVEMTPRGTSASSTPFYDVDLRGLMLQEINWNGAKDQELVEETVILQYGAMRVNYTNTPADSSPSITVYAQWSQVLNEASLDVGDGSGGTSVAPIISGTTLKTVAPGVRSSFTFNISDSDTAISSISSSATSLDTSLIANSSISITGTGDTRTVYFTANNSEGTGAIRISVDDNDGSSTRTHTVTIEITEPNAAPEIISPAEFEVCELSTSYLRGIAISDADALNHSSLTLTVSSGQLELSTSIPNGLSATQITGNGTGQLTLTAPIDRINTTLSAQYGLNFTPISSSPVNLNIVVNDNDATNPLSTTQDLTLLPILTRYEFWEREKFTLSQRMHGESDAIEDMDQDSNANLVEFAFNLDPSKSDIYQLPLSIVSSGQGSDHFQFSLPVRNNAPNLHYQLQRYAPATQEWLAIDNLYQEVGERTPINPEFDQVTLRLLDSVSANDSALVRIFLTYIED